ncbi:MAG: S-methyl-5-thioribose-1-phosphate isomerase [bacterium]|nr:S-methyl-5-thioribose-1-phosphate isomerase [bacterium]
MNIKTVDWKRGRMRIVDQTRLPEELVYIECRAPEDVHDALRRLAVRGAPAIGIAAAMGVVLGARRSKAADAAGLMRDVRKAARYIGTARPTAVNLFWALRRMLETAERHRAGGPRALTRLLEREALAILEEDNAVCRGIGRHGAALLRDGDAVLTHCNAGGLATARYGTALAVVYAAHEGGKRIRVYTDETRPLLQGARLTAWELARAGIDTTLICDNMAAKVMGEGRITCVITGADRIAANGDTANKIGTYGLAHLARAHRVPFYIAAPLSTIDPATASGRGIPIEERDPDEVRTFAGRRIAPRRVRVYNPAFDVTPARLISGIITEVGVLRPPYRRSIAAALRRDRR